MKRILLYTFAMVFVLALGVAYAEVGNGITDFSGLTYDIGPAGIPASVEGVSAGGMREAESGLILNNGVTDFSGKTYEEALPAEEPAIEASHAGGMREDAPSKPFYNGVTVF